MSHLMGRGDSLSESPDPGVRLTVNRHPAPDNIERASYNSVASMANTVSVFTPHLSHESPTPAVSVNP
jgi:hypothetical protein